MLGLGKQVLKKIQNLLVEVDRKRPTKIQHEKQQAKMNRSKSKSLSKSRQVWKHDDQPQRKAKPTHKRNLTSVHEETDKENICSHRIDQLYLNHFVKEKRLLDRNLNSMEEEMRKLKNFKVQNKTSQYLNQKQKLKPIYQRTPQIIKQKQKSIQKIKQTLPKKKVSLEDEDAQLFEEQIRKRHPKLSREEFLRKMQEMQQRNLLRMQKIQKKRLKELAQKSIQFTEKPDLTMTNKLWWQKKKLKKNLSTNVLQRFSQYDAEKRQKWEKYLQKRKQEETPFTPKISENTKQIVKKSMSRRTLIDNLPRSLSCRVLSKRDQSTVSFLEKIERIDKGEKSSRRNEQSVERNTSRHHAHGKSVATMSSSRNAMMQRRFL